jgi:Pyruvate/2-oxoacid:ferredoxin oxidoreductase delta subunit
LRAANAVMSLLSKLERSLSRFAIPNLSLYLVIGQVFCWGLALMTGFNLERIALLPAAVLTGEVWRLATFLFYPPSLGADTLSIVFMAFAWYMFYLMGSALEHYWGEFHYSAFIGLGWLLTVAAAFITPGVYASNLFLAGSVFLAFAYLNPNFTLLIFFILPVRIKWLALLQWLGYGFVLVVGPWPARLLVLAATGNFLVFFAGDIRERIRAGRRRMAHQARAFADSQDEREARHRCRVCGKTDLSHPQVDFRYCSKCAGNQCYCPEHIFNHEHVLVDEDAKKTI